MASHIHSGLAVGCRIGLIGLPDDTGVELNGGRVGAADGPRAFREALSRYGVQVPSGEAYPAVFDAGDIEPAEGRTEAAMVETHRRIGEAVGAMLDLGLLPVGIGGGHDLTYPFVHAVANRSRPMTGVYFDAHLDVRERPGSGMAFRRLVEDCGVRELHVFGLNDLVNEARHVAWFNSNGGRFHDDLDSLEACLDSRGRPHHTVFASLDLDVIDAAHAPGVSAPNPSGWTAAQASSAARACGRSSAVRCFDLMELNPAHDDHGRTARLAAHLFLSFLRGYAHRPLDDGPCHGG